VPTRDVRTLNPVNPVNLANPVNPIDYRLLPMALYLGLDASTQSLSAIVLEVDGPARAVVFERSLAFDAVAPRYGTRHGVLPSDDPLVAESSPRMWAETLDRMMAVVARESGLDLSRLRAVSGSGQQHGSVYLTADGMRAIGGLDGRRPLADQLAGAFSRERSPIWMDSSTAAECRAIERAVGGPDALARLTGSRAFERFTGPQIRKFAVQDPGAYARTVRVHLVSSFLASLVAGGDAPVDTADGAGMNLMDLARGAWAPAALAATAPDLERRLPVLAPPWTVAGRLAPYWRERYGFPPAKAVVWSGDNPCSLVGAGVTRAGRVAISLGTSDTLFGYLEAPRVDPSGAGHVFGAPTGAWMTLVCFKNGSLARERVRDAYGLDWDGFARALGATPPGNGGRLMLPWFEPEITPPVLTPGVRRYGLDAADAAGNVRAVVEAQMLAMKGHSRWMGARVDTIHATGGAAANPAVLQVMADVFAADVVPLEVGNSACLGAAIRAYHADELSEGRAIGWDEATEGFVEPAGARRVRPNRDASAVYARLEREYAAREAEALKEGST